MATHQERILEFVARFPGRDDDQISEGLDIRPRQTVNLVCRRLETLGLVRRKPGPSGKIANYPGRSSPIGTDRTEVAVADSEGAVVVARTRPPLLTSRLIEAGFVLSGFWQLDAGGQLSADRPLPKSPGIYAFAMEGVAQYVGLATMGLAKRLRFYARPGSTQRTSQRLNARLKSELADGGAVEIYTSTPEDLPWRGFSINTSAGLELGLIQAFHLPWNIRGVP